MPIDRKYPKAILDRLFHAEDKVSEVSHRLFKLVAEHNSKPAATFGLTHLRKPASNKPIAIAIAEVQLYEAKEQSKEAVDVLRAYLEPNGADDYLANPVLTEANRQLAKKSRNKKNEAGEVNNKMEIVEHLMRKGYKDSDDKATLVNEAARHFKCSEITIRRALKEGGLTRLKKT